MTLKDEIETDIFSGELDDLFSDVTWNGKPIKAMAEPAATIEGMDQFGGPMLVGERQFKFRRRDLLALKATHFGAGNVICYGSEVYDVREVENRGEHPIVVVKAELRT